MSLNTCLKDYFTLDGCSGATLGNSGFYLNRLLEGLEFKMLDYIADEQQSDFNCVWSDIQDRAIEMFGHDVRQELNKRFRLKGIKQSVNNERNIDTTTTTTASVQQRGFVLEQYTSGASLVDSNLQQFYVQTIALYGSTYTGDVAYTIYNLDTADVLKTGTIASVANTWVSVDIYEYYDCGRIFVSYDATNVDSVLQSTSDLENAVNTAGFGDGLMLNGATSAPGTPTTITKGNDAFGLTATWSVVCKWDNLVCQNIANFKMALAYCIGSEICNQRMYTSRLNEYTVFDRDTSAGLKQLYLTKYKGGILDDIKYDGLLTQSIEGINLNKHDGCIECNADINFTDALL